MFNRIINDLQGVVHKSIKSNSAFSQNRIGIDTGAYKSDVLTVLVPSDRQPSGLCGSHAMAQASLVLS